MTDNKEIELVALVAETASINTTIIGMVAENKQRENLNESMAYVGADFER